MKTLRMILLCLLMIGGVLMMTGCGGERTASVKDVEFLTAAEEWYHCDDVTAENEKMRFSEDFTFYWGCECGEPIGDSDCYELFDYDKESSIIKLYNDYDDMSMEMEVLDYSDYHLLLKIDGEIKDYTDLDPDVPGSLGVEIIEKYAAGYSGIFTTISGDEDSVILTHFDYDGDVEYPDNAFKEYEFADDVEFCSLDVHTHIVDGEVVEHNEDYLELDTESAVIGMEYGSALVWFDDDLDISKMMFYGATVLEE